MLPYVCNVNLCLSPKKNYRLTSGFILDTNSGLLNKGPVLVYPRRHPCTDLSLFILILLTSSFAAVIISTATRGHHLATNIHMGLIIHDLKYMIIFLMRIFFQQT